MDDTINRGTHNRYSLAGSDTYETGMRVLAKIINTINNTNEPIPNFFRMMALRHLF